MLSKEQGVMLMAYGALAIVLALICIYLFGAGNVPAFVPAIWTVYSWFLVVLICTGVFLVVIAALLTETKPTWLQKELRALRLRARSWNVDQRTVGTNAQNLREVIAERLAFVNDNLSADRGCGSVSGLYDECEALLYEADKLVITTSRHGEPEWRYAYKILEAAAKRLDAAESQLGLLRKKVLEA